MSKNVPIPEEIAERKIIVYKSRVDIKAVRATAEKMKAKLFRKFVFMKPKPEEVKVVSINRYFEPYVVVDGEYIIDYSKNWVHNIQVDDTMQELTIFGEKVRPKTLRGNFGIPCNILQLTGEGRFKVEENARIIFDKQWREVGLEQLPFLPFEEQPEKILSKSEPNFGVDEMSTPKEVNILKSRIAQRPSEILLIHNELFKVSERAVIFKPMYSVIVQNFKTKKEITMTVDGVTGKTASGMQTPSPQEKETNKEPVKASSPAETAIDEASGPVGENESKVVAKSAK